MAGARAEGRGPEAAPWRGQLTDRPLVPAERSPLDGACGKRFSRITSFHPDGSTGRGTEAQNDQPVRIHLSGLALRGLSLNPSLQTLPEAWDEGTKVRTLPWESHVLV